jgi:hypothetical protein
MKQITTVLCFMIQLQALHALPEVIIECDDVPFLIGTAAAFEQNTGVFQWEPFDSTKKWWDLNGYQGGLTARVHLLAPATGIPPAPDTFPAAEIVELDTMGSSEIVWSYLADTTFFFYVLGIDFETGGFRFLGNYQPDYTVYTYPIYDGAGWNTAWTWSYEIVQGITYTATEQHQKTIVAAGKVKVPVSADHYWPCLVIRDYTVFSDNFGTYDTRWIYEWVVPGRFGGANGVGAAQSTNGASPDFLLVENFFKMSTLTVPGWDLRCPDFTGTYVWSDTSFAGPFAVSTTITDSTGVGADSLFYNMNGGQFSGVGHDSVVGDQYYYTIPAVTQACTVGYFLWAEDSFSVLNGVDIWNTDPICAPESTYYVFEGASGAEEVSSGTVNNDVFVCSPNPFRGRTDIRWQMTDGVDSRQKSVVSIKIYDISGRVMKNILLPTTYSLLPTTLTWDGTDNTGKKVPCGTYFVEVTTTTSRKFHSVVLMR